MKSDLRIAFVVDTLLTVGGAEKTLFAALESFPNADLFTLLYAKEAFAGSPVARANVFTSYLNRLPFARSRHRLLLPLMPRAIERFDLRHYDRVVSFNYAVANGVRPLGAMHLSYTYTPMRYAWRHLNIGGKKLGNGHAVSRYLEAFRRWDRHAAQRILAFAAVSNDIAGQIRDDYGRESQVIYPPVDTGRFEASASRGSYYVVVSRLVAYKRIDVIVDAFSALGLPLKIIGDGPQKHELMARAARNIEFMGYQPDDRVAEVLNRAHAFVSAAEEDFGIAIVEAQAAGCPVITYGRGGALETVVDGQTGLFFDDQSADCIIEAVRSFERKASLFNNEAIADHARQFDRSAFRRDFERFVRGPVARPSEFPSRLQPVSLPVQGL